MAGSAAQSRCDTIPAACQGNADCDCLRREGPWVDEAFARDAGWPWPVPGKTACATVTCARQSTGLYVLSCFSLQ